jgi:hypothetical protein
MCAKVAKPVLKEYFRSGKRPNESQFHDLIDSTYNAAENYSCFVPGYHVLASAEEIRLLRREGGQTFLVPVFKNLHGSSKRIFNYSLPANNLNADLVLSRMNWQIELPQMGKIEVIEPETGTNRNVTLAIKVQLNVYNGTQKIISQAIDVQTGVNVVQLSVEALARDQWRGLSVDIQFDFQIDVPIPLPASFYQSAGYNQLLTMGFGPFGFDFTLKTN